MDSKSGVPLSGVAVVLSEKDSVKIPTEAGGIVSVPYTGDNVSLAFKATGYLSSYRTIDQSAFLEANATPDTILLEPLATGNTIALQNVLFYRGTANFVEGSERELGLVVEMMKENPDVNIFLKGHTDNVGNAVLNVQLSQARVDAVMDFLTDRGISADRISGKGYGGAEPVASNETEETRKLNRRVEFEIRRK